MYQVSLSPSFLGCIKKAMALLNCTPLLKFQVSCTFTRWMLEPFCDNVNLVIFEIETLPKPFLQ